MTHPLLTPRFEVIGPYPHSAHKVGDIIEIEPGKTAPMTITKQYDPFEGKNEDCCNNCPVESFREFSNLFKELFWWQRRNLNEMPDYISANDDQDNVIWVAAASGYRIEPFTPELWVTLSIPNKKEFKMRIDGVYDLMPATLEEYTEYINSKKTDK